MQVISYDIIHFSLTDEFSRNCKNNLIDKRSSLFNISGSVSSGQRYSLASAEDKKYIISNEKKNVEHFDNDVHSASYNSI